MELSGECVIFLSSVSLQQRFEMAGQCYSSVTAEFSLARKPKYTLKAWGRPAPKERPQSTLAYPLICLVSSPGAYPMPTGLAMRAVCFAWGSRSSLQIFLFSIIVGFPVFVLKPPSFCQARGCSSVLSHQNKDLGRRTLKPLAHHSSQSWTDHVIALGQISVTALFYLEDSRRTHPPRVRACRPKDTKRRE